MKTRILSESEKRDVAWAAMEFLKAQNPDCIVHVKVHDETDERGVPQYTATVSTVKNERPWRTD